MASEQPSHLLRLPLETLREIVDHLGLQDIAALALVNRELRARLLGNASYSKELLCKWRPQGEEKQQADASQITYQDALANILKRDLNLSAATPYDVVSFPAGSDFLYSEGVLCILRMRKFLDVYSIHQSEAQIGFDLTSAVENSISGTRLKLKHYSHGILSVMIQSPAESRLGVFRIPKGNPSPLQPIELVNMPRGGTDVVRNNAEYLVVGSYATTDEGPAWRFVRFALRNPRNARRLTDIGNWRSHDVGTNIVFEIFDDCFWVLTSLITFDPEGIDPISYYGGCRVRLAGDQLHTEYFRIYRRQQIEGPIHDSWTTLALIKDDRGRFLVSETRSEWRKPDAEAERSFYTTVFEPQPLDVDPVASNLAHANQDLAINTNLAEYEYVETMLGVASDSSVTNFAGVRHCHREFGPGIDGKPSNISAPAYRVGELAFCMFHPLSDVFVDIVWDSIPRTPGLAYPGCTATDRVLRVRIGSRRLGPSRPPTPEQEIPEDVAEAALRIPTESSESVSIEPGCQNFVHNPIAMYPLADGDASRIRRFVQPSDATTQDLKVHGDERAIVISTKKRKKSLPHLGRKIVVVTFDVSAKWRLARPLTSPQVHDYPTDVQRGGESPNSIAQSDNASYNTSDDGLEAVMLRENVQSQHPTIAIRENRPAPPRSDALSQSDHSIGWGLSPILGDLSWPGSPSPPALANAEPLDEAATPDPIPPDVASDFDEYIFDPEEPLRRDRSAEPASVMPETSNSKRRANADIDHSAPNLDVANERDPKRHRSNPDGSGSGNVSNPAMGTDLSLEKPFSTTITSKITRKAVGGNDSPDSEEFDRNERNSRTRDQRDMHSLFSGIGTGQVTYPSSPEQDY